MVFLYTSIIVFLSVYKKRQMWGILERIEPNTHETLTPFEVNSSSCNALVVPFQQLLEGPMEVILCERVNDLRHSLFQLLNCLLVYWLPYSSHTSHHPSQTPCFPWISYDTQKLMLNSCKMVEKQSEAFHTFLWHFFPSLKHNFIACRSSKVSDRIFEIHQLWQSGFSSVYSNSWCSCLFEPKIIKIGQSSHKIYSNNILNFQ